MRHTRSNRRIPFALITAIALLATSASAQVMPLPIGPPLARTDGPSYGPAYPPPQLVRLEPQSRVTTANTKARNMNPPATKAKTELKREPERRPNDLRRDRSDSRTTGRPPSNRTTSLPPDRGPYHATQAPRRHAQYSR
jgi:hypothetical protein